MIDQKDIYCLKVYAFWLYGDLIGRQAIVDGFWRFDAGGEFLLYPRVGVRLLHGWFSQHPVYPGR